MSSLNDITLDDVRRIAEKIYQEALLEYGELGKISNITSVLKRDFHVESPILHDGDRRVVERFTTTGDFSTINWRDEEAYLDFKIEARGTKNTDDLIVMKNALGKTIIDKKKGWFLQILIGRRQKEIMDITRNILKGKSAEELDAIVSAGESPTDVMIAKEEAIKKRLRQFQDEIDNLSHDDLIAKEGMIDAADPLLDAKKRMVDNRKTSIEREEALKLAAAQDIARQLDEEMARVAEECKGITTKKQKRACVDRLQWRIDVEKGLLAQSYIDGAKPTDDDDERIKKMEEHARLVTTVLFGVKEGIGYKEESFYETTYPADVCNGFPLINDVAFINPDNNSGAEVLTVDHELTDFECLLVARAISNDKKSDLHMSVNEVLEMMDREDLIYDPKLYDEEEDEDDDENDDDESGEEGTED